MSETDNAKLKWVNKSPTKTEWAVLQAAANAYLRDGMQKQEEIWRALRWRARNNREESAVKHWDQYAAPNIEEKKNRLNKKHNLQIANEIAR